MPSACNLACPVDTSASVQGRGEESKFRPAHPLPPMEKDWPLVSKALPNSVLEKIAI